MASEDTLRIWLFGAFRIQRDGELQNLRVTPAVQLLLAYMLLHHRRLHTRESLSSVFWGDRTHERARNALSTALWRLRKVLEPGETARGAYLKTLPSGEVGFNGDSVRWVDVEEFEAAVRPVVGLPHHALDTRTADGVEKALGLYGGDLLEGFCSDWVTRERERLRCLYIDALGLLMRYHGYYGEYEKSCGFGQRALELDPLQEEVHRYLIRVHLECANRPAAVRQFVACRHALRSELGIEPTAETRDLFVRLPPASDGVSGSGGRPRSGPALTEALEELRAAAHALAESQEALRMAIQKVERLTDIFPA